MTRKEQNEYRKILVTMTDKELDQEYRNCTDVERKWFLLKYWDKIYNERR